MPTRRQRDKATGQIVVLAKKGPVLAVRNPNAQVRRILQTQLTYNYVQLLRGVAARKAGSRVKIIPTMCYQDVAGAGKIPPQVVTAAGYYPRLKEALEGAGYQTRLVDNTQKMLPEVFQPRWERLQGVAWRWRQEECIRKILASPCGRIVCPTGYGKSFVIAMLARLLPKARIDIVTASTDIIGDIYADLCEHLPSVGIRTGRSSPRVTGERVMCWSMGCLKHSDGKAHFLLGDECQEMATQARLSELARYHWSRNFGFSANAVGDRNDGADFELEGVFGPVLLDIPYTEAVEHGNIVQLRVRWEDVIMDVNPCAGYEDDVARMRHGIWRNKHRNARVAAVSREYADAGHQVLVTVATTEHACFLKQQLPEFTLVYAAGGITEEDRHRYIRWRLIKPTQPDMTHARRDNIKKAFEAGRLKKVIATTVWNRGVNFHHLKVLVRADGMSSAIPDKQLPGRLSRLGKDYGVLVDFRDQFDERFNSRAQGRRSRYRKVGWDEIAASGTEYAQRQLWS